MHPNDLDSERMHDLQRLLRDNWSGYGLVDGMATVHRDLTAVAREIASAAHAAGLLPEQLIIAIKESWRTDCEPSLGNERQRLQWVLTELISRTIQEYFRSLRVTDGGGSAHASAMRP